MAFDSVQISRRDAVLLGVAGLAAAALPGRALGRLREDEPETLLKWGSYRRGPYTANITDPTVPGGNCLLVRTGEGALLIDSKFPYVGAALRIDSRETPITLVNTHHHADHTGGNAVLDADTAIAHEAAPPRIAEQFEVYRSTMSGGAQTAMATGLSAGVVKLASETAEKLETYSPDDYEPTKTVGAGMTPLKVGALEAELYHFKPGHTDNDLVVNIPSMKTVHTGDLVFHGVFPYYDLDGGADTRGWRESLSKTLELCDEDTLVIPGHGVAGDKSMIEAQIRYFDELEAAVLREIDKGTDLDTLVDLRWPFMEQLGYLSLAPSSIEGMYLELTGQR